MSAPRFPSPGRRLVLWFALVTLLPALALIGLAWAVVEQGHEDGRQRAAERAAAALERVLAALHADLGRSAVSPDPVTPETAQVALVVLSPDAVIGRAGAPLRYLPVPPPSPKLPPDAFGEADRFEHREANPAGARRALSRLVSSSSAEVRGEALLRLSRIHEKAGDATAALDALDQLDQIDPVPVGGLPAGLAARQRRLTLLDTSHRSDTRAEEAKRLLADLRSGRWLLSRAQYDVALSRAGGSEGSAPIDQADDADDLDAMAAAAADLWQAWTRGAMSDVGAGEARFAPPGSRSALSLIRAEPDRLTLFLIGPAALEALWREARDSEDAGAFDVALSDASGRAVFGPVDMASAHRTTLSPSVTGLPWTVHSINRGGVGLMPLSSRSWLMLTGIGIMALVVIATGVILNRAIEREVAVARLQSDFVNAVSHEFRTPLTTIRQLSELLARRRISSEEKRQQFYETLLEDSGRLHRLVEDLLDFGRLESGRVEYRFTAVDIPALVRETAAGLERETPAARCRIDVAADAVAPVRGDREALSRVFRNLLDNAVKYSPDERAVWVTVSNGGGRVKVAVRDRGIGIPADEQPRIFGKFVRGTAAAASGIKGTGIGLAMARQIIDAHGGEIAVASQPGQGSVFTVSLPAGDPS